MDATLLLGMLETNTRLLQRQTDGLTHDDSLLQTPFRGNCLNWVVGHIVDGRSRMLTLMGEAPVWDNTAGGRYQTDSNPITDDAGALPFDRLLSDLNTCHERLQTALADLSVADLARQIDDQTTLGGRLHGLLWHETYHIGQTELLRQLSGINDKVI